MVIDHLVVSGDSLKEACDYIENSLGVLMQDGGKHTLFGTHNRLLGLNDGLYLECIAIDPAVPRPTHPRWFNLDNFSGQPRLTNWVCNCKELEQELVKIPIDLGNIMDVKRDELNWRITVPQNGILPFDGFFPALIEWSSEKNHPAKTLDSSGCFLKHLTICHPAGDQMELHLGNLWDKRVSFEVHDRAGLFAEFVNSSGKVCLLEC